jgi:hypothetical protein
VLQRFSLVNCNVIGFVTLDDVLRLVLRSMVQIAYEAKVGTNLLNDHATSSSSFRLSFNLVTALELTLWAKGRRSIQPSYKRTLLFETSYATFAVSSSTS